MQIFQAIILSIVEGITEFLPISSTGHLVLAANLMRLQESDFVKSFEIIIQLGAILAVALLYYKRILYHRDLWPKLIVAFIPAGIVGLLLYKLIKTVLLGNPLIVVLSLLLGGIGLLLVDKFVPPKNGQLKQLTLKQSCLIGLCQSVSIIPGVSRSAATIVGGLGVGLSRSEAVEFSFLLAIPTMAAATGLDLVKSSLHFSGQEYLLLVIGLVGAFLTALLAIKTFLTYVQKHNFTYFGVYRIVLAILYWSLVLR